MVLFGLPRLITVLDYLTAIKIKGLSYRHLTLLSLPPAQKYSPRPTPTLRIFLVYWLCLLRTRMFVLLASCYNGYVYVRFSIDFFPKIFNRFSFLYFLRNNI